MENIKECVNTKEKVGSVNFQITLEDDFNVPDVKPDIDRIVTQDAYVEIAEQNVMNGRIMVNGSVCFRLLYETSEGVISIQSIVGKLTMEEMINMDEIQEGDQPYVYGVIEDVKCNLINSRKISVKTLITLNCDVNRVVEEEMVTDLSEPVQKKFAKLKCVEVVDEQRDILRRKEKFKIPVSYPNVRTVLYERVSVNKVNMRAENGKILVEGEVLLFALYQAQQEEDEIVAFKGKQEFESSIDCNNCKENRFVLCDYEVMSREVQLREDEDGEMRCFEVDVVLSVLYSILENREINYLEDTYALDGNLNVQRNKITLKQLKVNDNYQKRWTGTLSMEDNDPAQWELCDCSADILIDEVEWTDEGAKVEGSIEVAVLFMNKEKQLRLKPISIPMDYLIEQCRGCDKKTLHLRAFVDSVDVSGVQNDKLEVNVMTRFSTQAFLSENYEVIQEVEFGEEEKENDNYSIYVGYRVNEGDDLWSIAKKYHSTMEQIMELNHKTEDTLKEGEKLLIVTE